jgi:hypothetical protein
MDRKDESQFISYECSPWILGNSVCFGALHPDCVDKLTKCACRKRDKQCDHVAQVMALGGVGEPFPACLACARGGLASLVGVYCQFCHVYTEANIPWSPIPFVYICFQCSSRRPKAHANGTYYNDDEDESFVTYPSVPVKR